MRHPHPIRKKGARPKGQAPSTFTARRGAPTRAESTANPLRRLGRGLVGLFLSHELLLVSLVEGVVQQGIDGNQRHDEYHGLQSKVERYAPKMLGMFHERSANVLATRPVIMQT